MGRKVFMAFIAFFGCRIERGTEMEVEDSREVWGPRSLEVGR